MRFWRQKKKFGKFRLICHLVKAIFKVIAGTQKNKLKIFSNRSNFGQFWKNLEKNTIFCWFFWPYYFSCRKVADHQKNYVGHCKCPRSSPKQFICHSAKIDDKIQKNNPKRVVGGIRPYFLFLPGMHRPKTMKNFIKLPEVYFIKYLALEKNMMFFLIFEIFGCGNFFRRSKLFKT